jgi:hypothetical protein
VFRAARQQDGIAWFKADPRVIQSSQPAAAFGDEVELRLRP